VVAHAFNLRRQGQGNSSSKIAKKKKKKKKSQIHIKAKSGFEKARLIPRQPSSWQLRRLGLRSGQVQESPGKSITNRKNPMPPSLRMVPEYLEIE